MGAMTPLRRGGVAVVVLRPTTGGADRLGNKTVASYTRETVENVLAAPGETTDGQEAVRPHGTDDRLTLHFPKGYTKSLRGCSVEMPGGRWAGIYRVVGDRAAYVDGLTPGPWNRPVEVVRIRG